MDATKLTWICTQKLQIVSNERRRNQAVIKTHLSLAQRPSKNEEGHKSFVTLAVKCH